MQVLTKPLPHVSLHSGKEKASSCKIHKNSFDASFVYAFPSRSDDVSSTRLPGKCRFGGLLWVIAGWKPDVDTYYNEAWCTSDGTKRNAATTSAAFFSGATLTPCRGMAHCGLLLDIHPHGMPNEIWSSRNGTHWIQTSVSGDIFLALEHSGGFFFRDRIWVIGGQRSLNDAWASTDFSATS